MNDIEQYPVAANDVGRGDQIHLVKHVEPKVIGEAINSLIQATMEKIAENRGKLPMPLWTLLI